MIEIEKDDLGNILAVCEWYLVDSFGNLNDKGDYVWVEHLEINPRERRNGLIRKFIKIITDKVPWAKYGYFRRAKYDERVKMFSRRQWLKLKRG